MSSCSSSSRHCGKSNGTSADLKLSSYKLISETHSMEMDYEGENVFCYCGLKSPRRCSWTSANPGRRFYGCQKYPVEPCRFMRWHDEVFSGRAVELINELRVREKFLYEEVTSACRSKTSTRIEDYVIGENLRLRSELEEMRKKLGGRNVNSYVSLGGILVVVLVAALFLLLLK